MRRFEELARTTRLEATKKPFPSEGLVEDIDCLVTAGIRCVAKFWQRGLEAVIALRALYGFSNTSFTAKGWDNPARCRVTKLAAVYSVTAKIGSVADAGVRAGAEAAALPPSIIEAFWISPRRSG